MKIDCPHCKREFYFNLSMVKKEFDRCQAITIGSGRYNRQCSLPSIVDSIYCKKHERINNAPKTETS